MPVFGFRAGYNALPAAVKHESQNLEGSSSSSNSDDESRCFACLARLQSTQRCRPIHRLAWAQAIVLLLLGAYSIVRAAHYYSRQQDQDHQVGAPLLGQDPHGFVPAHVGQAVRWSRYDDASDPHYFPYDVQDSLEHVQAFVRVNGRYASYVNLLEERLPLPPFRTRRGTEPYALRAFHQMHCLSILFEDIGYRTNNATTKWNTDHVVHCLNTVRAAIMCLPDAAPISYTMCMGVDHTTDDEIDNDQGE